MIIIVGLGNPGKKYQKTRHNIGFRVVDKLIKKINSPNFEFSKKFNSLISEGYFNNEKIIIVKPQTFMNNSGKSVKKVISNFQFLISNLWVIHDDIDLPLGKIRIAISRGAAGHKGVESIIKEINSKNFVRFRIGIKPKNSNFYAIAKNVEKFVLQKFNKGEEKIVKETIQRTVLAIETAIKEGLRKSNEQV